MTESPLIIENEDFSDNETLTAITEEPPAYTVKECVLAVITAVLSFGFIRFTVLNTTGFFTSALYIAIITAAVVYLRQKDFSFSAVNKLITAVLYIFSLVYSITANELIKWLNTFFLFGGGAYLVYSVAASKKDIEKFLPFAMLKAVFEYPLSAFTVQPKILRHAASGSKFGNNARLVLIGLVLTVPLTAVVGALLISADDGLSRMFGNIFSHFSGDSFMTVIWQIILAVPCSLYLFGMLYSNAVKEDNIPLSDDECEEKLSGTKLIQNIVLYTAVTPICILYVMFFISQASYFLSAFSGNLPDGYSYSDYARQGFFELFAVTLINLAVIAFISLFAKNGGKDKPFMLKFFNVTISVFTLILIATAVSKMVMYISVYGLTQLRVYTTWFMLLCAVIFVLIIIKQVKFEFRFARCCITAFTVMFALLCFSRPDALIAKYNIEMFRSGSLSELDTAAITEMSDDALLEAVNSGAVTESRAEELRSDAYENNPYEVYNLSSLILYSKIS